MTTQQTIDFHRGDQLYLLDRAAQLIPEPPSDGRGHRLLRRQTAAAVLRAIDTLLFERRGREDANELSRSQIADVAGIAGDTVKRALILLEESSILAVDRTPGRPSRMAICWTDFQRLADHPPARKSPVNPGRKTPGVGAQNTGGRGARPRGSGRKTPGVGAQNTGSAKPGALLEITNNHRHQCAPEPGGGGGDWEEAREALTAAKIDRVEPAIALAKRVGWSAAELADAALIVRHTPKLGPGAIFERMRSGAWPAKGVPSIEELRERLARSGRQKANRELRQQISTLERELILTGRRRGASEQEIRRAIDEKLTARGLPIELSTWGREQSVSLHKES